MTTTPVYTNVLTVPCAMTEACVDGGGRYHTSRERESKTFKNFKAQLSEQKYQGDERAAAAKELKDGGSGTGNPGFARDNLATVGPQSPFAGTIIGVGLLSYWESDPTLRATEGNSCWDCLVTVTVLNVVGVGKPAGQDWGHESQSLLQAAAATGATGVSIAPPPVGPLASVGALLLSADSTPTYAARSGADQIAVADVAIAEYSADGRLQHYWLGTAALAIDYDDAIAAGDNGVSINVTRPTVGTTVVSTVGSQRTSWTVAECFQLSCSSYTEDERAI